MKQWWVWTSLAEVFRRRRQWKLFAHLLFRTYHFGVNNEWWVSWPSRFGLPINQRFRPSRLKESFLGIVLRSHLGFISLQSAEQLFPRKIFGGVDKKS